jgi:hypothetical protein
MEDGSQLVEIFVHCRFYECILLYPSIPKLAR